MQTYAIYQYNRRLGTVGDEINNECLISTVHLTVSQKDILVCNYLLNTVIFIPRISSHYYKNIIAVSCRFVFLLLLLIVCVCVVCTASALRCHPVITKFGTQRRGLTAYVLTQEEMIKRHYPVKGKSISDNVHNKPAKLSSSTVALSGLLYCHSASDCPSAGTLYVFVFQKLCILHPH